MNINTIYSYLTNTKFESYSSMRAELDNQYNRINSRDYTIDNSKIQIIDYSDIAMDKCHDRFIVKLDDILFQCLMTKPLSNQGNDSLFVIFGGSKAKDTPYPGFFRWSYYKFIDCYVLNIADPMFQEYSDLTLGWYYGTKNTSFVYLVSKIVKKIAFELSIQTHNIYFFGSSGGGYVSLYISNFFDNSTHIAINPQIVLDKFPTYPSFKKITGINLSCNDPYKRNLLIDIIKEKIQVNNYFIVQNFNASHDINFHLIPLLKSLDFSSFQIGLNKKFNFLLWLYDCIGGHSEQGDQLIFTYVLYFAKKLINHSISNNDFLLSKNISLLWKSRVEADFFKKFDLVRKIIKSENLANLIEMLVSFNFFNPCFINFCIEKFEDNIDPSLLYKLSNILVKHFDIVSLNYSIAKFFFSVNDYHQTIQYCNHILNDLNFFSDNIYILLAKSYFHTSDYFNFEQMTQSTTIGNVLTSSLNDLIQSYYSSKDTIVNKTLLMCIPFCDSPHKVLNDSLIAFSHYRLELDIFTCDQVDSFYIEDIFGCSYNVFPNIDKSNDFSLRFIFFLNLNILKYVYLVVNGIDLRIVEVFDE